MTTREGKAEPMQAVAANYAGGVREGDVLPVVLYDQNGNVFGASAPLKYVALVSQAGTANPTATVVFNNTGATIAWTRSSAGLYVATFSSSVLSDGKTSVTVSNGTDEVGFVAGEYSSETACSFRSWDAAGSLSDVIFANASVTIEIYP